MQLSVAGIGLRNGAIIRNALDVLAGHANLLFLILDDRFLRGEIVISPITNCYNRRNFQNRPDATL